MENNKPNNIDLNLDEIEKIIDNMEHTVSGLVDE